MLPNLDLEYLPQKSDCPTPQCEQVMACNVVEDGDSILTEHVVKSTVIEVSSGHKVGIIGYVLQDTAWISSPGDTIT